MYFRFVAFLISLPFFFFSTPSQADLILATKTFNAAPGAFSEFLEKNAIHEYDITLTEGQAMIAGVSVNTGTNVECNDNIELLVLNTLGESIAEPYINHTPSAIQNERFGSGFLAVKGGLYKVFVKRTKPQTSLNCANQNFPYTLTLTSHPGLSSPRVTTEAKTGIYSEKLFFADLHEYYVSLGNGTTFSALTNFNSGLNVSCYPDLSMQLYTSSGENVISRQWNSFPAKGSVDSLNLDYNVKLSGKYKLVILREPTRGGFDCDEAAFPYELHLSVPSPILSCQPRKIQSSCTKKAVRSCGASRKGKKCRKTFVNKCSAKKAKSCGQ